jgi:RecB family exonuclease
MEQARADYLNQPEDERNELIYAGHLPDIAASIQDWLKVQRAISPTALEELTHCRYLFLMNRILKLRAPNELDDFPLPLDRGKLMHAIFDRVFKRLATGDPAVPSTLAWAVQDEAGWLLSDQPAADAVPLVRFHPEQKEAVLEFVEDVAREQITEAVAKQEALGHPAVWAVEQEKLIQSIRTAVAFDVEHSLAERRYPALFEFSFDESLGVSVAGVAIKGKVDRVDLVFDEAGRLDQLHVLDYKGSSREQSKTEVYMERVMSALDCQLPLYAFAAQHYFFGTFDTPEVNARTKAGYIITERDPSAFPGKRKKALISMDEPELTMGFKKALREQVDRMGAGDFSVDPYHAGFSNYQPLLRNRPIVE